MSDVLDYLTFIPDWDNDLAAASSREKGKNEGRVEGILEGKIEIASKMKAEDVSITGSVLFEFQCIE